MQPPAPGQEAQRLSALHEYEILDTPGEQSYDDITAMAAFICDVPIALISLVDQHRQWFKSKIGINLKETQRNISFCAHAILDQQTMVVSDAHNDERFANNPLVTGIPHLRFYAGAPLMTPSGQTIGTLCVLDIRPRELSPKQIAMLEALARQTVIQLELRRTSSQLAEALATMKLIEGLIPICSYCKGIRNDEGFWLTVENFMMNHADVNFTHGVCDNCMRQQFPEVAEQLLGREDCIPPSA
ncbi:MAG: GAF domain-containing protein [Leptolyngbyaceae cyanobacterium]